jgi:hypothetical protein
LGLHAGLLRRRAWTYQRATYSPLVLILVLLGILGMPALRASRNDSESNLSDAGRSQVAGSGREEVAPRPDPVGKKLAGQSDQLSADDARRIDEHGTLGARYSKLLGYIVRDYTDTKVSAESWIRSTRSRLRQADAALEAMRQREAALTDEPSRAQLQRLTRHRSNLQSAVTALLSAVRDGDINRERSVASLVDRRLARLHTVTVHLRTLLDPYLTTEQREQFDQSGA